MQQQMLPIPPENTPEKRVVRIEKNLNSLGFFSPTSSTGKRKQEKVVTFSRDLPGGVKTEARATIMATSRGLPNTADLDKYLAFQLIVAELRRKNGVVTNPISFTTYQLLRLLGLKPTGKRYAEVDQWLDRMAGTLIKSEGAVYMAKTRRYMRDRFHVFDKVYTVGEEMPNGEKAEQNYVFLSEWQMENLNNSYVLPVTLEHYQQLRADIAKNLVPLLYIWFYTSRRSFQKRYKDLCQYLNVKVWTQLSRAREQFTQALTELQAVGYLSDWEICRTVDDLDFKLIFHAGPIFHEQGREALRQRDDSSVVDASFERHLQMLIERGVGEKVARRVLFGIPDDADVEEQVEWVDSIIARNPNSFENPAGMYVSFLRDGVTPPADFVSSRRRKRLEESAKLRKSAEAAEALRRLEVEERYADYREKQVAEYIAGLTPAAAAKLNSEARKAAGKCVAHFELLPEEQRDDLSRQFAFTMVTGEIPLLTLEEFQTREQFQQLTLTSSEGR